LFDGSFVSDGFISRDRVGIIDRHAKIFSDKDKTINRYFLLIVFHFGVTSTMSMDMISHLLLGITLTFPKFFKTIDDLHYDGIDAYTYFQRFAIQGDGHISKIID